jgi:prepilin-type N-terminal cleavage/methylation domain-containing protein
VLGIEQRRRGRDLKDESGFTLIESLVAIALISLLVSLSAVALRSFWFAEAVDRATGEMTSLLKRTQQRVVAETHPLVYGVWMEEGSSDWGIVKFDPKSIDTATDDVCTKEPDKTMADGVTVDSVTGDTTSVAALECLTVVPDATFVFFYARGTATEAHITLGKDESTGTKSIHVSPMTGRVERT